jgi:chromosomal replication initiator protein
MTRPNPTDAMSNRTASTEQTAQTARKAAMSLSDIRHRVFDHLRRHHGELCRHWFDQIEVVGMDGANIALLVTEPVRLSYLQRCCVPQFTEAACAATGLLIGVQFVADRATQPSTTPSASNVSVAGASREALFDDQLVLSPDYVFEMFVVGPNNRLAHAAAQAVAAKPGRAYNPFFVHGGVGMGKTHLLQAVCQEMLRRDPSARIVYISCSTFMDIFHEAVRAGRMMEFRHRFRNADMLVIDDIHFLSKHEQTQEEFFHTFNALYQGGRQIVLSSDAAPSEIPDLEERLVSRFNCGLVARIDRPAYETRIAILKTKAALHDLQMPDEVPAYIAARLDSNIRELEGALTRLRGLAMANGVPITLELAKQALADGRPADAVGAASQPTIQQIIDAVTKYYDIKLSDLMSKRRHKSVTLPRQVCMWLARKHTRFSLEEIGGYFGGRDHTTVMHAVRTVGSRAQTDAALSSDVTRIEQSLERRETV